MEIKFSSFQTCDIIAKLFAVIIKEREHTTTTTHKKILIILIYLYNFVD